MRREDGFTLVELLITVAIIAIMAGMILFAMYRAQEAARAQKTRALIARLDAIIKSKWEAYKTRRVPVVIRPGTDPMRAARLRLDGLHDLMRMELPDRYTDIVEVNPNTQEVTTNPALVTPAAYTWPYSTRPIAPPALFHSYRRRIAAAKTGSDKPSLDNQGAEMLYLIVTASLTGDEDTPDVLRADSIGDTDGDGMPEFVDGWGRPIGFLRWPAGFPSELNVVARGIVKHANYPRVNGQLQQWRVDVTFDKSGLAPNASLSNHPGAYIGFTIAHVEVSGSHFAFARAVRFAKITDYTLETDPDDDLPIAKVTCRVPTDTRQRPFRGDPAENAHMVILAPDPFDPQGVYPMYPHSASVWPPGTPDWSLRTWAIYPLIYSAGSDGYYELFEDTLPTTPVRYVDKGLSPFYINDARSPGFERMGAVNISRTGWLDNIHNHQLVTK